MKGNQITMQLSHASTLSSQPSYKLCSLESPPLSHAERLKKRPTVFKKEYGLPYREGAEILSGIHIIHSSCHSRSSVCL